TSFAASTVPVTLAEELQRSIETYLDKNEAVDDHDSQKLQEELLSIYQKDVKNDPTKHAAFVSALKQLGPGLGGESRLNEWWKLVIQPVVNNVGYKRAVVEDAQEFLLGILVYEDDDDQLGQKAALSAQYTGRLLDLYLMRTRIAFSEDDVVSQEDESVAQGLESILVAFGRRKPKNLLLAIDNLLLSKERRLQALGLLCAFVRHQPAHLYTVVETQLIEHLLICLMNDTSTTVISLALTSLIMFLPHIPSSLVSHLPRLFLIYSRLLCWEKFSPASSEAQRRSVMKEVVMDEDDETQASRDVGIDPTWDKLESSFELAEPTTPEVAHYFTYLYGLYPLNFTSYIRKPRKYLKNIKFPGADDFDLDQAVIRSRTEQFRQVHLLHPNFYTTTVEDELTDNRWLKSDSADVVMECTSLCIAMARTVADPGPPPTAKLPEIPEKFVRTEDIPPHSLLAGMTEDASNLVTDTSSPSFNNSWRNTQSTAVTHTSYSRIEPLNLSGKQQQLNYSHPASRSSGSPALGSQDIDLDSPTLGPVSYDTRAQESLRRNSRSLRTGSSISGDVGSPRLGSSPMPAQPQRSPAVRAGLLNQTSVAFLQQQVMLLTNNLNFERYLRQQQQSHIGQMQRKHIKEATIEAETQNLLNTNRTLKQKLAAMSEFNERMKKEAATGRNQSKKWEGELSAKVRSFREDQKHWRSEEDALRLELQKAQKECEQLRQFLVESERDNLILKQKMESLDEDMKEMSKEREELEELQTRIHEYEARELDFDQAREEQEILRTELDTANLRLRSNDEQRERSRRAYISKIAELESRLKSTQHAVPGQHDQLPPAMQNMLDSTLRAAHAKFANLHRAYSNLLHKHTNMELENQEYRGLLEQHKISYSPAGFGNLERRTDEDYSSAFARQSSITNSTRGSVNGSVGGYSAAGPRRAQAPTRSANYDDVDPLHSPSFSPPSSNFAGPSRSFPSQRPTRTEPQQRHQYQGGADMMSPRSDPSPRFFDSEMSAFYINRTAPLPPETGDHVHSSSKSAFSVGSESQNSDKSKSKIQAKSEKRVYGRGGAQNVKMKDKEGEEKEKRPQKTGGFRGLKGIM
ncbi:hypothetical protein LTR60_002278, partial [Cryomyces antarcticus]